MLCSIYCLFSCCGWVLRSIFAFSRVVVGCSVAFIAIYHVGRLFWSAYHPSIPGTCTRAACVSEIGMPGCSERMCVEEILLLLEPLCLQFTFSNINETVLNPSDHTTVVCAETMYHWTWIVSEQNVTKAAMKPSFCGGGFGWDVTTRDFRSGKALSSQSQIRHWASHSFQSYKVQSVLVST